MRIDTKGKALCKYSLKRIVYTLCFFLFCVIDQRVKTCSGRDGWLETFRNLTGVGMAVVILSHYKREEFRRWKIPYLVWSAVSLPGAVIMLVWGASHRPFLNEWLVAVLDVVLFGYIVIHTFIAIVLEKRYPKTDRRFAAVWTLMLLWMVLSKSDYLWPVCYLVMFGCFYLTDFTEEEQEDLFQGILNGIILGFFILQGLCFVFRPYDRVRYQGIYHNPNLNALFYLEVLAAVFGKILYVTKKGLSRWLKVYYWLGAGVVLAFLFLSIGRTAWIAAFLIGLLFLWHLKKICGKKNFIRNGATLVLCACLMFPVCFGAARYLPPLFHHPVWFWGEWSDERVHSWDPWDSEKYVDMDEFLEAALGRLAGGFANLLEHSPFALKTEAAETADMGANPGAGGTPDEQDVPGSILEDGQEDDSLLVRGTIYKYYFTHLNLLGHKQSDQGFQLMPHYWIGHAHNIFLQYGTDFGVPVMLLFLAAVIYSIIKMKAAANNNVKKMSYTIFLLIPVLFGLLEYSWGSGSLSILMLFVSFREAWTE